MTTDALQCIARDKAHGSAALEKQWTLALQRLASTGLGDDAVARLCKACGSPAVLSRLARLLSGDADAALRILTESCDASRHDLAQWLDALDALYGWLEERSRTADLAHALGYLSCCSAASPEAKLAWAARKMLDQYGMDRQM